MTKKSSKSGIIVRSTSAQVTSHKLNNFVLLCSCALMLFLSGCKKDEEKQALAEAAQARVELVKTKAEVVALKSEVSFLKEKLLKANQARDQLREQLNESLQEHDTVATEAQDAVGEIENLKAKLAEQTKKSAELEKQVDQLKGITRELQTRLDEQKATAPKEQPQNE